MIRFSYLFSFALLIMLGTGLGQPAQSQEATPVLIYRTSDGIESFDPATNETQRLGNAQTHINLPRHDQSTTQIIDLGTPYPVIDDELWSFDGVSHPDTTQFVYTQSHLIDGTHITRLLNRVTGDIQIIRSSETAPDSIPLTPLAWTPDDTIWFSERAQFYGIDHAIWKYNPVTGLERVHVLPDGVNALSIDPSGTLAAYQIHIHNSDQDHYDGTYLLHLPTRTRSEIDLPARFQAAFLLDWLPVDRIAAARTMLSTSELRSTQASAPRFLYWPVRSSRSMSRGILSNHKGLDIIGSGHFAIYASAAGTVVYSGVNSAPGWNCGNSVPLRMVVLRHSTSGGTYYTMYLHGIREHVRTNQSVHAGQHIADAGSTGCSTGIHLHFEVRRNWGSPNSWVNPASPRLWIGGSRDNDADMPPSSGPPDKPTITAPNQNQAFSPGNVTIRWNRGTLNYTGEADYFPQVSRNSSFTSLVHNGGWQKGTSLTLNLPQGNYYVRVNQGDTVNQSSGYSAVRHFKVIGNPGRPTITAPNQNQEFAPGNVTIRWNRGTLNLTGEADYFPQVSRNSSFTSLVHNGGWQDGTRLTLNLPEGNYYVRVNQGDTVNQTSGYSAVRHFKVIGNPGRPTITAPNQNQGFNPGNVTIRWNRGTLNLTGQAAYYPQISRNSSFTDLVRNGGWQDGGSVTVNLSSPGTYYARVNQSDKDGRVSGYSAVRRFEIVDNVRPTIHSLTPSLDAWHTEDTLIMSAVASDGGGSGVAQVTFFVLPTGNNTQPSPDDASLPLASAPEHTANVSANVAVTPDGEWQVVGTDTNGADGWSVTADLSGIDDQDLLLYAEAVDRAGNVWGTDGGPGSPATHVVRVDRQPPEAAFALRYENRVFNGTGEAGFTFWVRANDAYSGVQTIDYYVGRDPDGNGPEEWGWDLFSRGWTQYHENHETMGTNVYGADYTYGDLPDQSMALFFYAFDEAGNSASLDWETIYIDRTPPIPYASLPIIADSTRLNIPLDAWDNLAPREDITYTVHLRYRCDGTWHTLVEDAAHDDLIQFTGAFNQVYCFRLIGTDWAGNTTPLEQAPIARTNILWLAPDINGDYAVTPRDAILMRNRFGPSQEHNASMDLNGDDTVDGQDVQIMSTQLGRYYPATVAPVFRYPVPEQVLNYGEEYHFAIHRDWNYGRVHWRFEQNNTLIWDTFEAGESPGTEYAITPDHPAYEQIRPGQVRAFARTQYQGHWSPPAQVTVRLE